MRRAIYLILLLFFIADSVDAQQYRAFNISLPEGLSQSTVFAISQDNEGFVWIGTQDGLNRFDGLRFRKYYNHPFDSTSISSGNISALLHDSRGNMWVGTSNEGLNLYLPDKDCFRRFKSTQAQKPALIHNSVTTIKEDSSGYIWVGTFEGITRFKIPDSDTGDLQFVNAIFSPGLKPENMILSILPGRNGNAWVGTRNGLYHARIMDDGKLMSLERYGREEGLEAREILAMTSDAMGRIWISSSGGLYVFDVASEKFSLVNVDENKEAKSNGIYGIHCGSDQSIWLASMDGVYRIDSTAANGQPEDIAFTRILNENKFLSGGVMRITEDRITEGLMWAGTEANGVVRIVPVTKKFTTNHLDNLMPVAFTFSIFKDSKNYVWAGTTNGLVRIDREKNDYKHITAQESNYAWKDYINSIIEDDAGGIWIASSRGFYQLENPYSRSPKFKIHPLLKEAPYAPVRKVIRRDDGVLMVLLPRRLYSFDPATKVIEELLFYEPLENEYRNTLVFTSLHYDSFDNLWIGSYSGLFLFRNKNGAYDFSHPEVFRHNPDDTTGLRSHSINSIASAGDDLWLCTSNGLTKVIQKDGKISFRNYSTADGMSNNQVYGMLVNPEDNTLWFSSNGGLTKFNPATNRFTNYDVRDGLQSNEFNGGSYYRASDNEFFFGGVNGYTSFYPGQIKSEKTPPLVSLTGFTVAGTGNLWKKGMDKIELTHDQNSFSIDFTSLHFTDPYKNRYQYKLEGFHSGWVDAGGTGRINFSHLPPGEYLFRVKGSNNDGLFSRNDATLSILIHPPFWQTWGFYVLIALAVTGILLLLHFYRLRMKVNQMKEIENIRKEIAEDFHDELGHKLTTITWFGEILKNKLNPAQTEMRSYLSRITESAGTLYHTMKDLMWAMDPSKDSVADLYVQIREFGESLFDQTGVEFLANDLPENINDQSVPLEHKRHVLLIFKEAMHNSFRHSKGTRVHLSIEQTNSHITLSLADNGTGFKVAENKSGYGLRNVERRSRLINGKLRINTGEDGTRVDLDVPINT